MLSGRFVENRGLGLFNLNRSATVVAVGRDGVYTTGGYYLDIVAVYAHLDEFGGNGFGASLAEALVDGSRTRLAVGITRYDNLAAGGLGCFGYFLDVYEILAAGNLRAVEVEEYAGRSADGVGNGLRFNNLLGLLVGEHVAETSILVLSILQRSVQRVELFLIHGDESIYVGSLFPRALAEVEGQAEVGTYQLVPMAERAFLVVAIVVVGTAVVTAFECCGKDVEEDADVLRHAEVVEKTEVVAEVVGFVVQVVEESETYVGNEVPYALLVVAAEDIGEVEQHVFVDVEVLERVVVGRSVDLTHPMSLILRAKTEAGAEPLTDGGSIAERAALRRERSGAYRLFLRRVGGMVLAADANEPIGPEAVGGNAVLFAGDYRLLSKCRRREDYEGESNYELFHKNLLGMICVMFEICVQK